MISRLVSPAVIDIRHLSWMRRNCLDVPMAAILLTMVIAKTGLCDQIRLVAEPDDAMATALELIDQAQQDIAIATYVIDSGDAAATMLRHAAAAAQRGVRVRLLHDAFETPLPKSWVQFLYGCGIEIRNYNPPCLLRPIELNWRMHSKMLVVDRWHCLMGSRNWQDSHYGVDPEETFIDQDVLVHGPSAAVAADYFDRLWCCDRSANVSRSNQRRFDVWNRPTSGTEPTRCNLLHGDDVRPNPSSSRPHAGDAIGCGTANACDTAPSCDTVYSCGCAVTYEVEHACLIIDADCDKSRKQFAEKVDHLIDGAQWELTMETPYPAFSLGLTDRLVSAARRGVRVQLLTNSYRTIDQKDVYAAYMKRKRRLLRCGVEIHEVVGDSILHAKTMTVDRRTAMIGSYNFDARSERFNLEVAILVHDADFTKDMLRQYQDRKRLAVPVHYSLLKPSSIGLEATVAERVDLLFRRLRIQACHRCL